MDIGVFAPSSTPAATLKSLRTLGPAIEQRGFRTLWVAEHALTFDDGPANVRGSESGTLDPFVLLGYLAATTSTLRLGTGVTLISQRNPVFTAKQVASLDVLSDGRFDLGVGVGWIRQEFTALGLRRDQRGTLANRNLEVMRRLWMDDVSQYSDDDYELPPSRAYPKPVQVPHPPIHIGGHSDAAFRRIARFGQGWYAFGIDVDQFTERLGALEQELHRNDRTLADLTITVCPYGHGDDLDSVKRYRDAGADQVVLNAATVDADDLLPTLDRLESTVVDPAKAL